LIKFFVWGVGGVGIWGCSLLFSKALKNFFSRFAFTIHFLSVEI